jgi:TRAP-type C4-dicarboxylate transport system substrate-binding protein
MIVNRLTSAVYRLWFHICGINAILQCWTILMRGLFKAFVPFLLQFIVIYMTLMLTCTHAQIIKLGTVAPDGSEWHKALKELAHEWKNLSDGKVVIQIYAGGIAGDDPDLIRKMRIGQLQAAALATSGIAYIYPDITALTFPNNIKTDDELRYVIKNVGPFYEEQIYKKGFKILCWSNAGWVHFFSKNPVVTPDDMKKQKLFFWGSESNYFELLKRSGFNPVALSVTDLLPGLQTGLVTAFASPPQAALAFQWYASAPNMCNLRWQPLPGVVVITDKAWEQISEKLRLEFEKCAAKIGAKVWNESVKLDNKSIEVMKKHNLKVHQITPDALSKWEKLINNVGVPVLVGHRFSCEIFDKINTALKEYREKKD